MQWKLDNSNRTAKIKWNRTIENSSFTKNDYYYTKRKDFIFDRVYV